VAFEDEPEKWNHWALPWDVIEPEPVNGADPRSIYLGDDIFATGLFYQRKGESRNVPIVRMGTIAGMPDEPVTVELGSSRKTRSAKVEAYLVELHSQQGLSGCPVFVVETRDRNTLNIIRGAGTMVTPQSKRPIYLLGLISGHFGKVGDKAVKEKLGKAADINYGIAVVVPYRKIVEFFNGPEIQRHERSLIEEHTRGVAAKMD
jgi:hypothetical protein